MYFNSNVVCACIICSKFSKNCVDKNSIISKSILLLVSDYSDLAVKHFLLSVLAFLVNDGVPMSLHQEEIKANICGIMDGGMNSLTSELVVWVPLNVTSMHVPDRWSGTRLMGMFNTWARCQFRQACP